MPLNIVRQGAVHQLEMLIHAISLFHYSLSEVETKLFTFSKMKTDGKRRYLYYNTPWITVPTHHHLPDQSRLR